MAFYDSIKLEKGMYNSGLTKTLESLDPSENYDGTDMSGLDAYERQLKRFNIKVKGEKSDILDSFFKSSEASVLFPEFVRRSVEQGMQANNTLESMVAAVTTVDCDDYRTLKTTSAEGISNAVSEADTLPQTTIKTKSDLVSIKKFGRIIASSYEALRNKRLDLFAVTLRQIGAEIAKYQVKEAASVLVGGDEFSSGVATNAASSVNPVSASGLAYADLLELWTNFSSGFDMNTIIANKATMQVLLNLSELKEVQTILSFKEGNQIVTPFGANLHCVDTVSARTIVGFDKNCALEMVKVGDLVVDYDKLIDKQLERSVISSSVGFAKIFDDAVKTLTYTAAAAQADAT